MEDIFFWILNYLLYWKGLVMQLSQWYFAHMLDQKMRIYCNTWKGLFGNFLWLVSFWQNTCKDRKYCNRPLSFWNNLLCRYLHSFKNWLSNSYEMLKIATSHNFSRMTKRLGFHLVKHSLWKWLTKAVKLSDSVFEVCFSANFLILNSNNLNQFCSTFNYVYSSIIEET